MTAPWLEHAKQYIGTKEVPGSGDNKTILKWMKFSGLDESYWHDSTAWCAIFTSGMLEETGFKSTRNAMARSYLRFGEECKPKAGAIMVMPRGKPPSGHVGIVEKVEGSYVHTIEGNVSNAVVRKRRKVSYGLGFRWPTEKLEAKPHPHAPIVISEPATNPHMRPSRDKARFDDCLAETLKWEGGFSNDPYDTGGATMKGVIQRVYNAYRKRKGKPQRSVRQIDDDELKEIYQTQYWNKVEGFNMPPGLDLAVFDFGVNSGPYRSITKLQGLLGLEQDGLVGPITEEAVKSCDVEATIKGLCQSRRAFVRQIKTYWRFGKGWERRISGIEVAALSMVGAQDALPDLPLPKPDADAQSATQGRADEEKPKLDPKTVGTIAVSGGGAVGGALQTDVPGTVVESVTKAPLPPQEVMDGLSSWQAFSMQVQSATTMAFEHWPYVLAAFGIYGVIVYGLPWLYRNAEA